MAHTPEHSARISLIIRKELKEEAQALADMENRSLNNWIETQLEIAIAMEKNRRLEKEAVAGR